MTNREKAEAAWSKAYPTTARVAEREAATGNNTSRFSASDIAEAFVNGYTEALAQCEADVLERVLVELRAQKNATDPWREKEHATLSKAIARIEKLKPAGGT